MIVSDEELVQMCELDEDGEICFTKEYLSLTDGLGWGARRFAAHFITHWTSEFQNMLDYFGPDDEEEDKYSGVDGEPMDVREDVTDLWEFKEIPFDGLDSEWHRDVLRAKLVFTKIPRRLIVRYVKAANRATIGR